MQSVSQGHRALGWIDHARTLHACKSRPDAVASATLSQVYQGDELQGDELQRDQMLLASRMCDFTFPLLELVTC